MCNALIAFFNKKNRILHAYHNLYYNDIDRHQCYIYICYHKNLRKAQAMLRIGQWVLSAINAVEY